ncbi:treacle protein-like isoform X3 [Rhineura floridana]|uniref:treacle protein-like isoform X3 n=1 Tax=Rhineura floridana TaxID=261503 RepID=UPI002AC7F6BA|nr:treacle protein-like isoform X3 [Rhineura floridana]
MADLDHSLSLVDALTEPQPQIEEEVKRDFIATLEAEKFDDTVGETVGKTDYVPLLDDDDPKSGNQEVKTKPHADNVPVERMSATGPAAVVENGDHGIESSKKVSPGKTMDEKMSYEEFLDRNDSWTVDDRDHRFESQLPFKPMDVSEPFKMHREDVLSDLLLLPQEMTNVPPFGEYFGVSEEVHAPYGAAGVPEQPPLGAQHSPASIFDPLAFLVSDSGAESLLNQNKAAPAREMGSPEDFWLGGQHLVEGQGVPFFAPPVPSKIPDAAEMHFPGSLPMGLIDVAGPKLPKSKESSSAGSPPVGGTGPAPAVEELIGFEPSSDHTSLPPEDTPAGFPEAAAEKEQTVKAVDSMAPGAGSFPVLEKREESKPSPTQQKEKEGSSWSSMWKAEEEAASMPPSGPKAEDRQAFLNQLAGEVAAAATRPPDQKAEESKPFLFLPTEKEESKPPSPKGEELQAFPTQHTEKVEESKPSPTQHVQEAPNQPSAAQKAEELEVPPSQHLEKVGESKVSPSQSTAADQEEAKPPSSPSQSLEHFPVLEKLAEKDRLPPSKPAEKPEEHKQPRFTQPVERLPEPVESKESVPLGESKGDTEQLLASTLAEVAKPKEASEPGPAQPVELPQEKVSLEPAGPLPAQVRRANKSSDHRRLGRVKPARLPVADDPEELLAGLPAATKSHERGGDPFPAAECGSYIAGTSPRSKAPHRKAAGQPFEFGEAHREGFRGESWDQDASAALKKKKKKTKQKRSQQLRAAETWEDNSERLRAPRKSELPVTEPHESAKEVSGAPAEVLDRDPFKLKREGQLLDGLQILTPVPAKGELALQPGGASKLALDAKAGEFDRAEAMSDDSLELPPQSKSRKPPAEPSKHGAQQDVPGGPTEPQAAPLEVPPFGKSRRSEGQAHKDLGPGMFPSATKPAVSREVEITPAKPAVAEENVAPEGLAPFREVLAEEPKREEKGGRGKRAGEGAAKSPVVAKTMELTKETSSPDKSKERIPVASESLSEASPFRELSPGDAKGSSPAKSVTLDFGSVGIPFVLETKSEPIKPLPPAEMFGSTKVPSTDTSRAASSSPPEQPAGAVPRLGSDQPKKRGSDGRSKRANNSSDQRRSLSEDRASLSKASGAEGSGTPVETSFAAGSSEAGGFSSAVESEAVLGSAGVAEKPKRSSDGKSRKAVKRSSLGASFSPGVENSTGHLPAEVNRAGQTKERTDSSPGADFLAASQLLEAAAETAKLQTLAAMSLVEEAKGAPDSKSEWLDFPSSAYPFIVGAPAKGTECPVCPSETKGDAASGEGVSVLESPTVAEPASELPAGKPKKRSSDGRSKKSGKSPSAQPFLLEAASDPASMPPKKADVSKEAGSADGVQAPGDAALLQQRESSQAPLPAAKPTAETEVQRKGELGTRLEKSCFEQPPASDLKTSTPKPELFTKAKETLSAAEGQEASLELCVGGRREGPKPHHPLLELTAEEQRAAKLEGQSHQVCSQALEAKPEPARPGTVEKEVAKTEETPSPPSEGKEKGLDHPLEDTKVAGQAAVTSLVVETSRGAEERKNRKGEPCLEHPFLSGAKGEVGVLLASELEEKPREPSSPRSGKEGSGGGSALSSRHDLTAKAAKRGSDRKSKKAASGPNQPTLQEKADSSKGQHPEVAGFLQGMEETELVDENRNIKSLPPGHEILWEENRMSLFGPSVLFGASGLIEAASKSQGLGCPFLEDPGKFMAELSKEELFLPAIQKDASKSGREDQREVQENSAKSEGQGAMIETSLLVKAGDETREKRKKSKRPPSERLARQEARAGKDQALCSVPAEHGGKNLLEQTQSSGLGSSKLPVDEEPKVAPLLVAGAEGIGLVGRGTIVPPVELPALWQNKREAAALQALTAALVGGSGEPTELAESSKGAELRTSEGLDSLGSKAGADKAPEDVHMEEAAPAHKPKDLSKHPELDDVNEPKISLPVQAAGEKEKARLQREAAEPKSMPSLGSEPGEVIQQAMVADCGDQVARETKKEERKAKAPEQMKGYMRPTKSSRGLPPPPPPLRVAAPEQGRRRPAKPDGLNLQRQAKPEEIKPATEVVMTNDIAAPPSKELPPSPEKKAKPSASTPAAKPAAVKTKPVPPAAAAPAKRPASTTPGQNKKAASPTAGPAAATTPKRPATGTTRPSTLTPKDSKPKGTDAKSPDKRTSPLKPPSSTTPRPSTKSSPATPKPSTALTSTNASSPRSTAASPPKRPSTIKTDAKPTDAKKTAAKSPSADLSRPKSAPASSTAKSSATTPTAASPGLPGTVASRPKPAVPRLSGTGSAAADSKKASMLKAAPQTSPVPKPPRPPTSVSAPDLKNVRSKIGSTDNIKHQPGGGKAKIERKAESAGAARKPELNAVSKTATTKTAVSKEGAPKQPNGKVQIVSKKANYSHVQSKCGSKDNIKHVPGGGNVPNAQRPTSGNHSQPSTAPKRSQGSTNVQILNKKIDLSKVSSKCGSKTNIKHKPGGGDVKIENQKLTFKEKAQAKVGSLDNVGHVPAGGTVKTEGGEEGAPQNGAVIAPLPGGSPMQENGVGLAAPTQGGGDQREIQCFDTRIQETSI